MALEIITKEDLEIFGEKLINQMRALLAGNENSGIGEQRKFLKSYQVKNMLKISPNTLQSLRQKGTLPFTKVGGIFYYDREDILKILKGSNDRKTFKFSR
jgi:hypothetical protein